jgi:hypothetical protein
MRVPIRPGIRLSVWEPQNPEAIQVTVACYYNPVRVTRVLSMRGWACLLLRYDWRDAGKRVRDKPAEQPVVQDLTRELYRRVTHLETARAADEDAVPNEKWVQIMGEVIGLQGALGIALGGRAKGGNADELAQAHYRRWIAEHASELSRCDCDLCMERMGAGR